MNQGKVNNQRRINHGLPPRYRKKVNNIATNQPISMVSSSTIPLATSHEQIYKKATNMSYGSDHSTTDAMPSSKPYFPPCPQPNENMILGHAPAADNSSGNPEAQTHARIPSGGKDPNVNERNLGRKMSNKMSSMRARIRKYEHKKNLEKMERIFEVKLAVLRPQIAIKENEYEFLLMENRSLNQSIINRTNENMMRDALIEENQNKVTRLRQLLLNCRQQMQQLWNLQPVRENGLEGVLRNLISNQLGRPQQMIYPNPMEGNQQVVINQPVGYGGVSGGEAYNGPELLNPNMNNPNPDVTDSNLKYEIDQMLSLGQNPSNFL